MTVKSKQFDYDGSPTTNRKEQQREEKAVEREQQHELQAQGQAQAQYQLPLEATATGLFYCQFSSWFSTFYKLEESYEDRKNVTIKSKIIKPLPIEFINYLQADGIRLPKGATKLSSCALNEHNDENDSDNGDNDDNDENDDNNDKTNNDSIVQQQYSFPELNEQIIIAIQSLGGSVVPKFNWSCPKDATWINEGTLKCRTPGDIYLLLKSSDFCSHDLLHIIHDGYNNNSNNSNNNREISDTLSDEKATTSTTTTTTKDGPLQLELVLRKWCNLYPNMEFRCFVRNHILIGMSQRNHTQHYPHLLRDRYMIRSFILEFFDDVICHRFANNKLPNYVFDLYIDKGDRVWLIDFNVWSVQTDALLYTWDELVRMEIPLLLGEGEEQEQKQENDYNDDGCNSSNNNNNMEWPELRIVETSLEVRHDPLALYRAPMDTVELASSTATQQQQGNKGATRTAAVGGAARTATFEAFMAMCQKPSELDNSDSEDESS